MKAAVITKYGKPNVLQITDLPKPTIKPTEVLVKVKAASINPKDAAIRKGQFKIITGSQFPLQTGADFSGTITEIGNGVKNFKVGDNVYGYLNTIAGRTVAEYLAVPEKWLGRKPNNLTFVEAAAMPCTYLTSLQALRNICKVKTGERVCLYGASGGVGSAAIQLGKELGVHITTISSSRNLDFCKTLGADETISYQTTDIFEIDKQFDVFYQIYIVGGNLYQKARQILRKGGRFVGVSPSPQAFFQSFWTKLLPVPSASVVIVNGNTEDLNFLTELVEQGHIKPHIDHVFSMQDIQQAHEQIASKHTRGKIVLEID